MKISFNRKIRREPWGGGAHFLSSFYDHLKAKGHTVTTELDKDVDVIFMLDPRYEDGGYSINEILKYKHENPNVKVVHRVNECDKRKGTHEIDRLLCTCWDTDVFDRVIFISDWLYMYFLTVYSNLNDIRAVKHVVRNGCNQEWFYPKNETFDETTSIVKVVTHHWSDNFMKGFDVYEYIDSHVKRLGIEFTYIGRYNQHISTPKNTRLISPLYGEKLGEELRKHDIYVTASRWEPCGMHHIEAAACGLPVLYHKDGGAIPEMCIEHGVEFSNLDNFDESLRKICEDCNKIREKIDYKNLGTKRMNDEYECIVTSLFDDGGN